MFRAKIKIMTCGQISNQVVSYRPVPYYCDNILTRVAGSLKVYFFKTCQTGLLQLSAAYLGFIFGKFACKVNIQEVSFALPLNLATPAAVAILIGLCTLRYALKKKNVTY